MGAYVSGSDSVPNGGKEGFGAGGRGKWYLKKDEEYKYHKVT